MEAIITIVGFLGAGKTTLLKHLINSYLEQGWDPFVILNDYENAYLDSQQLSKESNPKWIKSLSGSCICCSGLNELRATVNRIPKRENGITLIEANGTSDACSLLEFLGVGIDEHYLPPIQISVVDVKNWQKREEHNELEANQIQASSLIVLTHLDQVTPEGKEEVTKSIEEFNPSAKIVDLEELDVTLLPKLNQNNNKAQNFEHLKAHWASCSVDLPILPNREAIERICKLIPSKILRVKGCAKIDNEENYTYFERTPDGKVTIRPFNGIPVTGTKLLTIGAGSEISVLEAAILQGLQDYFFYTCIREKFPNK
ncbi:GTP-binding protein [Wenyingzhuangia sp. IMCC45574]